MNYTIDWMEIKTSKSGKPFIKATLTDSDGKKYDNVTIFTSHKEYSGCMPGAVVTGSLKPNDYNGVPGFILNSELAPPRFVQAKMNNERKAEAINQAMDKKADGIMVSSTARDATAILTTFFPQVPKELWLEKWLEIRQSLVKNWDNTENVKDY